MGWEHDTMIAHGAVSPDAPHNLAALAGEYTDAPPWKPGKEHNFESFEELVEYNAHDCVVTSDVMQALERELQQEEAKEVYRMDIQMSVIAAQMDQTGLLIDKDRWQERRDWCVEYLERATRDIKETISEWPHWGDPPAPEIGIIPPDAEHFNPASPRQLCWALYEPTGPVGAIPSAYSATGQPSTNMVALLKVQDKAPKLVKGLLDHRKYSKILGTYLDGLAAHIRDDGRLHVHWKPQGARTGRWSSTPNAMNFFSKVEFDKEGKPTGDINIKKIVVAPPGRKLVGADSAQAELRVAAALSGDEELIRRCRDADEERKLEPDHDPHSFVALIAFGQPYLKADKDKRKVLRDLVKRVFYGLLYGSGAQTIWTAIYDGGWSGPPITIAMVERTMAAVFEAFPKLRPWQEKQIKTAQQTGYVFDLLYGRRRVFPLRHVKPTVAVNYSVQSTIASMINATMWELYCELPDVDPTAKIVAQVHDSITIECDERHASAVAQKLEDVMSQELKLVEGAPWMAFPATASIGDSWDEVG